MSSIDSILDSVKKSLGLDPGYTPFDPEIIMHINSVFSILHQLGVGPEEGFMIEDAAPVWADFLMDLTPLNTVKTYMYLRVRYLFDPPGTSFALEAMKSQIEEFGWRINLYRESQLPIVEVVP